MFKKFALSMIFSMTVGYSFADTSVNDNSIRSADRCFYSSDQYQFNGVHVSPNGSTSYVINSNVEFYSHDGKEEPSDLYKGELALEDEDGITYQICIKGGDEGALTKIELSHSARISD